MKRIIIGLLNAGYWVSYCFLLAFMVLCLQQMNPKNDKLMWVEILFAALVLIPSVLGFYSFYTVIFDRFLSQKKFLQLALYSILTVVGCGIVSSIIIEILAQCGIGKTIFGDGWNSALAITLFMAGAAKINGIMGLIVRGFISWYNDLEVKLELQKKTLQ
jgi:two-component system, LytTR family, sensor kinase